MKKHLIAAATLATFAGAAFAAPSVTLYGIVDTGLGYQHQKVTGQSSTDELSMTSSVNETSRWGLKGEEKIGNTTVSFNLADKFNTDDGTQADEDGRLFGREAQVNVSGAYGTLYAGRLGSVNSDNGTLGYLGDVSAFPSGFGIVGSQAGSTGTAYGRYDNVLAYQTPAFSGLQAAAMYSFKADSKKDTTTRENTSFADRYAAAGLRYKAGKAAVVLAGDYTLYSNSNATYKNLDNGYSVILGGNYDFGVAKVFAKATYFDNQASATDSFSLLSDSKTVGVEGWGVELSTAVPAFGGAFLGTVGYRDAKDVDNSSNKFKRWNAAVGYSYAFSKRTSVYAAAGYAQEKANELDRKASAAQAGFGLVHKF